MNSSNLIEIKNLKTHFFTDVGILKAVDGIDFSIKDQETFALVGESGCGKSVTALSLIRLVPEPPGKIIDGSIIYKNEDLLRIPQKRMQNIRGKEIAMIFQEPMTSLNPVYTIGNQIAEAIMLHQGKTKKESKDISIELLRQVGIPSPAVRFGDYPHQMSGGMRQRVMIAMAIACKPSLLIADEPTTALDVTVQAQILSLLRDLKEKTKMAMLLITHDLGLVAETADRVGVMYASKIVEMTDTRKLFDNPCHPYTLGLLQCIPRINEKEKNRLYIIEGTVPNPLDFPVGCKFHPRCRYRFERCSNEEPVLNEVSPGHDAACFRIRGGKLDAT
jgi:peptide/nickel transport system ATP-binding protein/oligopeptide transport system ATP-binding protein